MKHQNFLYVQNLIYIVNFIVVFLLEFSQSSTHWVNTSERHMEIWIDMPREQMMLMKSEEERERERMKKIQHGTRWGIILISLLFLCVMEWAGPSIFRYHSFLLGEIKYKEQVEII